MAELTRTVANVNGTNPNAIFTKYPLPNTDSVGDGLDYRGFTFAAPTPTKHDTYILKLDYKPDPQRKSQSLREGSPAELA